MASRPEDPVVAAAKVIRIIHDNHAAASQYLHILKVTPGTSRSETKEILQNMEQEEYNDVLEDLDASQKATFFDKVAGLNEKPSQNPDALDDEITKKYFEALNLKAKGLSFKDVCAQVKKVPVLNPPTTPALPSTPLTSRPYREAEKKVEPKEQKPKGKPVQQPVKVASPLAQTAPVAPTPAPKASAAQTAKLQKEKAQKDKQEKKRKREEETPKASKKPKTGPEEVGGSKKRQKRREKQKMLLSKVAAGEVPLASKSANPILSSEPVPATIDSKAQPTPLQEDVHMESPEPAASVTEVVAPLEIAVQAIPKSKKVRRSKHKSAKAKSKSEDTEQPLEASTNLPDTDSVAPVEGSKKARSRRRKVKAAEAAPETASVTKPTSVIDPAPLNDSAQVDDASSTTSDEDDNGGISLAKENSMSDFVRRTTLPVLGKPTISATADPSSDEEQEESVQDQAASGQADEDLIAEPTSEAANKPTGLDTMQRESSSEAVHEESPSPTTRETSVSSAEEAPSSPEQQEQKKSSPVTKKTELSRPTPSTTIFTSALAQPSFPKPLLSNSFTKPQSSFASSRSTSSSKPKKSANDSFAEFAAFASGKKPGLDDSSDDDDDDSSSSSDSDNEMPAPVQARNLSPVQSQSQPKLISQPIASESEPSAMDVDTESGAVDEEGDPVAPAIDVVMTDDQQHTSSPIAYNDSQPSAQEAESVVEEVKNEKPVGFQSFHENSSTRDAPARSPLPEIPSPEELMDFGGYQPTETNEQVAAEGGEQAATAAAGDEEEQTSEPANRENHEGPELTEPSNSIELEAQPEVYQVSENLPEADEQASSSSEDEQDSEDEEVPEVIEQSEGPEEAEEAEEAQESENKDAELEDPTQPSASVSDAEEPAEAFTNSMQDFLDAWEEETDNFEHRIQQIRQLLVEDGDGSVEDNKDILEKLLKEVDREDKVYKSKTAAARKAIVELEQLARERIEEVLDRADASFEQRLLEIKSDLREEYNAESARAQLGQLSPELGEPDVEMKDKPEVDVEMKDGHEEEAEPKPEIDDEADQDEESSAESAPSSLGWAPSDDEGLTESAKKEKESKKRKPRKSTGATSEHFTPSPKKQRVPAGTSAVPFPKLSAPRFGLIQERLANDPYRLLLAVTFLNKTAGRAAVPIFEKVMERYPTPQDLAAADVSDLSEMIHSLGFQNQRARKLIKIAETWIEQPPQKGKLFRTMDYPSKGNGRHLKPKDTVDEDVDDCVEAGALEIAHIYGSGPYAWDSWRIFCRDKFRGVADGYNGEGVPGYNPSSQTANESDFEPEWKRVIPLDKELRACLRWMWLREGWEWDPLTGKKHKAAPSLLREASDGIATWDEPVAMNPHNEDPTTIKQEISAPRGAAALVPSIKAEEVKTEDAQPAKKRTRRSRNSGASKRAVTPPSAVETKEHATPAVAAAAKVLNAEPEIMTSRLRPRAGRTDAITSAAVPATPSRRRARK
ncbi:DNA glycosylase [Aureobasidium subglaciale]|nr:DNA glycosylase [Aureobasidium subglaciale]KAI5213438.1 DNA glycosylase [Aureobasidium subglaciale]KAI5214973.1 DNA glycosylase [Aureobasidium subglaciale]KAI5252998.1 DNA glycosylase [Aureobasidium subglaciale]